MQAHATEEYITECSVGSAGSGVDAELLSNYAKNMVTSTLERQMDIRTATADAFDEKKIKFILNELIQTEKAYVRDLQECIDIYMREMLSKEDEIPPGIVDVKHIIFGNILEVYEFHHSIFLKELEKYEHVPEVLCHMGMYIVSSKIQQKHGLLYSVNSYLLKPVQRITKYPLLLKDLLKCCEEGKDELKKALDVTLSIPKRANNAIHLSVLEGFDDSIESQVELLLQDCFKVWDSKIPFKMGKHRQLFLLKKSLVLCKVVKDDKGKSRYLYKRKLNIAEIKLKEHLKGDPRKFAFSLGRTWTSSNIVLKAFTRETKMEWIEQIRKLIQEHTIHLGVALKEPRLIPKTNADKLHKSRRNEKHHEGESSEIEWPVAKIEPCCIGGPWLLPGSKERGVLEV
ncbi:triple functional domain protein-like [Corythoichthys intestinalis]|uniref:triple functional domain protein-like n=1 Tax=Corythoichthys intestinalis TaxID=161448 RepID=UPI0025A51E23|nr:triple functional domain protein-like [Corythoichthys intestinalis]